MRGKLLSIVEGDGVHEVADRPEAKHGCLLCCAGGRAGQLMILVSWVFDQRETRPTARTKLGRIARNHFMTFVRQAQSNASPIRLRSLWTYPTASSALMACDAVPRVVA